MFHRGFSTNKVLNECSSWYPWMNASTSECSVDYFCSTAFAMISIYLQSRDKVQLLCHEPRKVPNKIKSALWANFKWMSVPVQSPIEQEVRWFLSQHSTVFIQIPSQASHLLRNLSIQFPFVKSISGDYRRPTLVDMFHNNWWALYSLIEGKPQRSYHDG